MTTMENDLCRIDDALGMTGETARPSGRASTLGFNSSRLT
jgi:hypothetical protein